MLAQLLRSRTKCLETFTKVLPVNQVLPVKMPELDLLQDHNWTPIPVYLVKGVNHRAGYPWPLFKS